MNDKQLLKVVRELAIHLHEMCPLSWSPGMGSNYFFESLGGYSMYLNACNDDLFVTLPDSDGIFKMPKRANVVLLFSLIAKIETLATLVVPKNEQLGFKSLLQELKKSKLHLDGEFEVILICDHINTEGMRKIDEYVSSKYGVELKTFFVINGRAETFVI